MPIQPSSGAAALAAALSATACAGISPGTYASWTNLGPGGGFVDDNDPASTFGSYSSQVTDAAANLTWAVTASSFSGSATGGNQIRSTARGAATFTFSESMDFSITWNMAAVVRDGNLVGWTLVDLATGNDVYAVSYENLAATTAGGAAAQASGSLVGSVGAGSYLLVMAADCFAAGGSFSYGASFTAVPAPGALALLALAGCPRRRRR